MGKSSVQLLNKKGPLIPMYSSTGTNGEVMSYPNLELFNDGGFEYLDERLDIVKNHQKTIIPLSGNNSRDLAKWNGAYKLRANENPKVVMCEFIKSYLNSPIRLPQELFTRKLIAQNPPKLDDVELKTLSEYLKIQL